MSHRYFKLIPVVMYFLAGLSTAAAQVNPDSTTIWVIETRDGNEYFGKILERDAGQIRLETIQLGIITIRMVNVKAMRTVAPERIIDGELWAENPQATRYLWGPNAYGLRKGEGYYQNVWILFNQLSFGINDHITVGFGMIPIFLFGGEDLPVWITPKFSIPLQPDKWNLGVGALVATSLSGDFGAIGVVYGVSTFGSRDKNFSLGLGYGFADGTWAELPTLSASTMLRLSKRTYLISENYLLDAGDENILLLSLGGRTVFNKISLDYGGIMPVQLVSEGFLAFPWLGIVIPLGKAR